MNRNFGTQPKTGNQAVFGIRAVMEAIESGKDIESLLVQKGISGSLFQELRKRTAEFNIPIQTVPIEKLNRISTKNHQGVIAFISPIPFQQLESIVPMVYEKGEMPLVLLLDRITDVRNFGAIARSAECMGVHAIVIPFKGAAQINPDAIKTSAGALYKIPVCREHNLKESLVYLKESGLKVVACTEKTDNNLSEANFNCPVALILGSEEDGVSAEYLKLADDSVKIPLMGEIASLNVSVANGIALYEVMRQRAAGR